MVLRAPDIAALVAYLVCVVSVGVWASRRGAKGQGGLDAYFLAGRSMWWLPVGASLFVSNIGAEHLVGLAGSAAASGISVGAWELNALTMLQLLGWVFLPVYLQSNIYTVPEYLTRRLGGSRLRVLLAVVSIILYITTRISADLFTAGIFMQQALGWNLYVSVIALVCLAGGITLVGGLRAVIYTETLQMTVIVAGSLLLTILSFVRIGGFPGLVRSYPTTTICGEPAQPWMMFKGPSDPYIPWPGFLFGQTIASVWYWCTDQVIVQRALAAKNLSHGQGATLMAGFLKLLPLWTMCLPGMISRVLFADEVGCDTPESCQRACQNPSGCSNIAYAKLVVEVMPLGVRGVLLAALVASLMGSFESMLNSASSLFIIDLWQSFRPLSSEREEMMAGKVFLVAITAVSVAWIPLAESAQGAQVFIYLQEISAYLAPPIAGVYLMAVLWPGATEAGAFYGLATGIALGLVRLVFFIVTTPSQGSVCPATSTAKTVAGDWLVTSSFIRIHYMYIALVLFGVTVVVGMCVSLFTAPPSEDAMRMTYWEARRYMRQGVGVQAEKASAAHDTEECKITLHAEHHPTSVSDIEVIQLGQAEALDTDRRTVDTHNEHDTHERSLREECHTMVGVSDPPHRGGMREECRSSSGAVDSRNDHHGGNGGRTGQLWGLWRGFSGRWRWLMRVLGCGEGRHDDPLKQSPTEKAVLCVGLVCVLLVDLTSYVGWAVWDPRATYVH